MQMNSAADIRILIVEDDDGHAALIFRALQEAGLSNRMLRFANGEDAWRFFCGEQGFADGEAFDPGRRYLILMDINMPRMDGIEVLRRIKEDETLRALLVIMLTTTNDPREVAKCYRLGCNAYMTKPAGFQAFTEAFKRLASFLQIITM